LGNSDRIQLDALVESSQGYPEYSGGTRDIKNFVTLPTNRDKFCKYGKEKQGITKGTYDVKRLRKVS